MTIATKQEICKAYQKLLVDSLPSENTEEAYQNFFSTVAQILYEILGYIGVQENNDNK